jgi:MraZ protein
MFNGVYSHVVDVKSRTTLPVQFREGLGEGCVITYGMERNLFIYPKEQYMASAGKIKGMPKLDRLARRFERWFIGGSFQIEFDQNGRFVIPKHLVEHAELKKDAVSVGVTDRVELWSKDRWERYNADWEAYCEEDHFISDDMAERLKEMGF